MKSYSRKTWSVLILAALFLTSCACHQHSCTYHPREEGSVSQGISASQGSDASQGLSMSQNPAAAQAQTQAQVQAPAQGSNPDQSQDSSLSRREKIMQKALKWIIDHPASFQDGGFLEMGEEANLFYVLSIRAKTAEEKQFYRDRLARILQELRSKKDFRIEFAGEITAYLAITKAAEKLGFETGDLHQFIKREILNSEMTYPPNITYVILNSALLRDLGYEPKVPMETSIGQGVIASMTKNSYLIPIGKSYASDQDVSNFFYDITHEIFAISSFGDKNPETMLMPKELEFVQRIIPEGINLYLPKKQLDILCELVVCAKIMNYTNVPGLEKTVDFIFSSQEEDGAFGVIPRMKDLGRGNIYRHGVLVAVWALAS
ncbi:MAG: hypothetical protein AB1611_07540 [bacterium]